ncbi:MAG: NADPH-dependent FMN reductase [Heyndrickxia sp.]
MSKVVFVSGSPSVISRTDLVLRYLQKRLEREGFSTTYVSVLDIPAEDLLYARFNSPELLKITQYIQNADGIIIGSPVYKASYTGVLKALLDLLPEGAFKNKSVFPIMVGGSKSHLLAIDYALRPVIANLKGKSTQGVYLLDKVIDKSEPQNPLTEQDDLYRLHSHLNEFIASIHLQQQFSV